MTRKNAIALLVILIIFGFALWTILPIDAEKLGRKGLHLGLDLVGGVHLVYEADATENATELDRNMKRVITTIQKRIDKYGVAEPVIQQLGDDRVLIQLPGFTDIDAAKSLVEQTGFLEFREVELTDELQPVTLGYYLEQSQLQFADRGEPGDRIFVMSVANQEGPSLSWLKITTKLCSRMRPEIRPIIHLYRNTPQACPGFQPEVRTAHTSPATCYQMPLLKSTNQMSSLNM